MNFKIGDKVRIITSYNKPNNGDAVKYKGNIVTIKYINSSLSESFITDYLKDVDIHSKNSETGIWFSNLELVNNYSYYYY